MNQVSIRFADPARDAGRILAVYRPFIENTAITFEDEVPGEAAFARRVADIARDFPYLLLEVDGELAGYAYAHRQHERAAYAWNAELTIYLDARWQHKGLGAPLYALLMRLLERQGYISFFALITASNAASLALHEKLGFAQVGYHARTGWKFGAWHDVAWLCRRAHDGKPGKIVPVGALDADAVAREIAETEAEIFRRLSSEKP